MPVARTGLNFVVVETLERHLNEIEIELNCDAMSISGPIIYGLETRVRDAIEMIENKNSENRLAVILNTPGGIAEVVERIVDTMRAFYDDVTFIIPDRAMSAGTILAMSGDTIMMDYFSRLGPIDPQVVKDDVFVPATSYLIQFKRLIELDRKGELTNAEFVLLEKFDLAELHQYEQAKELSISLLKGWLASYKFKNWTETKDRKISVTPKMREDRAKDIAEILNNTSRWHSHGRGISRETLESDEIKLEIDPLDKSESLHANVRKYHHCLSDYLTTTGITSFVHSRAYI